MIEFRIKRLGQGDWRLMRAVRLRALADAPDAFSTTLAEDEARSDAEWQARTADGSTAQFVALSRDHRALGMAVGAPHTRYEKTAGLFGMWVAPEARRRRIGCALVDTVIEWARGAGYSRIILDVGDTNRAAIRLYESCGFQATGVAGSLPPPREHVAEHERARVLEGS